MSRGKKKDLALSPLFMVSGRGEESMCFKNQRKPKLENMAKNLWKQALKGRRDSFGERCVGKGEDGKVVK